MTRLLCCLSVLIFVSIASADPVPLTGDTPVDVATLRVDNPAVLPMSGDWRFRLEHGAMRGGQYTKPMATASSVQLSPDDAIDGKPDTRWCASSDDLPQWWQLDLGGTVSLTGVGIQWEIATGRYGYKIEVSSDSLNWKPVADHTVAPGAGDGNNSFPATDCRYVRIFVSSAEDERGGKKWASIREANFKIVRDGKTVLWTKPADVDHPADDGFAAVDLDDSTWHGIPVPGNWEMYGFSRPTYDNADDAVGLYRRVIEVPRSFANKTVLWHFDGVMDGAEVFINGQRVGYHESGFTAFDIDVTKAVKPGEKNLFAVRVCKSTPSVSLDSGDFWNLGGIYRENYLVALPAVHVSDVTVVTTIAPNGKDFVLNTKVKVAAPSVQNVRLVGTLFDLAGNVVGEPLFDLKGVGGTEYEPVATITSPRQWSAEKPNLYYLLLTVYDGDKPAETVQQRFGFRQVTIDAGVLKLNNVPIKLTGTCRHEEWAVRGHALTEHEWQTDVAMMKSANINAVRTSHYNDSQRFLELCEEKGFYVLDEIPACWSNPRDPKLLDAFVLHAKETLDRDKNRPCVIAWSCGNESGFGPNFKAMADYAMDRDPTRPAFVSCEGKSAYSRLSFNDYHYPGDAQLKKIAAGNVASILTEQPHIFYVLPGQQYDYGTNDLWGEALAAVWDRVWPAPSLAGAFIWEWQDQGLADKFADRKGVDSAGLRNENHKGIVDAYRNPKPEYYHVKMVYSPVEILDSAVVVRDGFCRVRVKNRYAFTNLSELGCRWTTVDRSGAMKALDVARVTAAPGETVTARFTAPDDVVTAYLEFIHPDGRSVVSAALHTPNSPTPPPPQCLPADKLRISTDKNSFTIENKWSKLGLATDTGRFVITTGDQQGLTGPTLNLGELRADDGDFLNKNEDPWVGSKLPPVLKNVIAQAAVVDGVGQIVVTADVSLVESPQKIAELTYTVAVHPDWQMDVHYDLRWTSADRQAWEFGLKFDAPKSFDMLSWVRHGLWSTYPADHIGANTGIVKSDSPSFRASKRDCVWASLTDGFGGGYCLLKTDTPLHVRANATVDGTTLFASSLVSAPRDFSSGYLEKYKIHYRQGETRSGSFVLRPVGAP